MVGNVSGSGAVAVLCLSLAAKMYMSFKVRTKQLNPDYQLRGDVVKRDENAGKAQLNVAEYEPVFMAMLLFLYIRKSEGLPVTIVSLVCPLCQAIYFWGRALSGGMMPWAPLGTLPRYMSMGIMVFLLYDIVCADGFVLGPGSSAVAVLFLSLAAKMYMSFCVRVTNDTSDKAINAGKAQLNVAEYEGVFLAILLFLYMQKSEGLAVTIVSLVCPLCQAIYFWGRALSGGMMPWAPLGTLPRYMCMGIMVYLLYDIVCADGFVLGPGSSAVAVLFLSLAAKMYMSFCVRVKNDTSDKAMNAGKAQLNVAEYEGLFLAILLFLHMQKSEGLAVTIVSLVCPLAQAIYFWGRALTGGMVPWAPLGALPRYMCMVIMVYLLYSSGLVQF